MSNRNFTPRVQKQTSPREKSLSSQLSRAIKQGNIQVKKQRTDVLPNLETIGEDGVDHINIWEYAQTELGKCLSHDVAIGFIHPVVGRFKSIVGFFNYIRSEERDDRLRQLSSKVANTHFKKLTPVKVPGFKALVMDANWLKVQQNPALKAALMESTLPFDCWYTYKRKDGVRQRPAIAFWIVPGFTEIRNALLENREPNWGKIHLLGKGIKDLYAPIRPVYKKDEPAADVKEKIPEPDDSQADVGALLKVPETHEEIRKDQIQQGQAMSETPEPVDVAAEEITSGQGEALAESADE